MPELWEPSVDTKIRAFMGRKDREFPSLHLLDSHMPYGGESFRK